MIKIEILFLLLIIIINTHINVHFQKDGSNYGRKDGSNYGRKYERN